MLILGGDLTGKAVVPIHVTERSASFNVFGKSTVEKGKNAYSTAADRVRSLGFYPQIVEPSSGLQEAGADATDGALTKGISEQLGEWEELATERLGRRTDIFVIPGNDDHPCVDQMLRSSSAFVSVDRSVAQLDNGLAVCGLGVSNETPWKTFRELPEETIAEELDSMMEEVADSKKTIWNVHVPPTGVGLDICEAPDSQESGAWLGRIARRKVGAGSSAVSSAIRRHEPLLGLFGHVHEGRGAIWVDSTLCINPGSEYFCGVLHAALIDLDGDTIRTHQLLSG